MRFGSPPLCAGRQPAIAVFGDDDRLRGERLVDPLQVALHRGDVAAVPAFVVLVPHDVVHLAGGSFATITNTLNDGRTLRFTLRFDF